MNERMNECGSVGQQQGKNTYLERENALKETQNQTHTEGKLHVLTESPQFLLTGPKRFTWKDFFWKVFRITVKKYFMFFYSLHCDNNRIGLSGCWLSLCPDRVEVIAQSLKALWVFCC